MKIRYYWLGIILSFCFSCTAPAQRGNDNKSLSQIERIYTESATWVDSVMGTLTHDQKIAQLFWLSIANPVDIKNYQTLLNLVEQYQPGGILIMQMPLSQAFYAINNLQELSTPLPLLVSVDAETGLSMRMSEVIALPNAMTLGAVADNHLIYRVGLEVARQLRTLGIHVNMAPVADVNSNPNNPIIGTRSFGENPYNVAQKSIAFMQGLQDGRIMAVGKHFPGHGDTSKDSHYTLPVIHKSREVMDSIHLKPFKMMVDNGLWAVMTAHLQVPSLEPQEGLPTSFSKKVIEELLCTHMGFKGLVITDAVNMKGAKFMGEPGKIDALALVAGNDIVEFTEDLPEAIRSVKKAVADSLITWDDIELKCRKSLAFKYWLAIDEAPIPVAEDELLSTINNASAMELNQQLYDAALTVLKLDEHTIRDSTFLSDSVALVVVGKRLDNSQIERYPASVTLTITKESDWNLHHQKLKDYNHLIVVVTDSSWGLKSANNALKAQLAKSLLDKNSTVVFMGNPYHISNWKDYLKARSFLLTYQNSPEAFNSAFKFLLGKIGVSGQLPVTVNEDFKEGFGWTVE